MTGQLQPGKWKDGHPTKKYKSIKTFLPFFTRTTGDILLEANGIILTGLTNNVSVYLTQIEDPQTAHHLALSTLVQQKNLFQL